MGLKRRTIARVAASNAKLKSMEQKAHNNSVQTYSAEILNHLTELELKTKLQPTLIQTQPQITVNMRPILFDFLMDVHNRLKLSISTFFLMINIIDRYCSMRIVRKDHFQLLGLTALWLASKYSDSKQKIPSLDFLRATCCNCYSKKLFLEMECHILKSLNWEIGSSTHDSFIDLLLKERIFQNEDYKAEEINEIKNGSLYLCQLSQFYTRVSFNYSISTISIASVILMTNSLIFKDKNLFLNFKNNTIENQRLAKCCETLLSLIDEVVPPQSIRNKYFSQSSSNKNSLIYSIKDYSNEFNRLKLMNYQQYSPSTPSSSTSSIYSSSLSRNSSTSSSHSIEAYLTPPSSCNSSPVGNHPVKDTIPIFNDHQPQPHYTQNLQISCPPSYHSMPQIKSNSATVAIDQLDRKRLAWSYLNLDDQPIKKNYTFQQHSTVSREF